MDSPLLLHRLHQSTTMTTLFLKLAKVRIFPRVIVHTKKLALNGILTLQIVFHGNDELVGVATL
jgi:hypothetical protein